MLIFLLKSGKIGQTSLNFLRKNKDNVQLLTPELLEEINQLIVTAGHELLDKKKEEVLRGRCDSFVVETHVHYP